MAVDEAEAREEKRKAEGQAVVQQLMSQLQQKEELLAQGAVGLSEEEREELMAEANRKTQNLIDEKVTAVERRGTAWNGVGRRGTAWHGVARRGTAL